MPLHPLKLPPEARDLCRIVAMQRKLFKALTTDPLDPNTIDESWLARIWPGQTSPWIHHFCRTRSYSILEPIRAIAGLPIGERQAIYINIKTSCAARKTFQGGGHFCRPSAIAGLSQAGADAVEKIGKRFYKFLGIESAANWSGFEFPRNRSISLDSYKTSHAKANPNLRICPYCDGHLELPPLDHYYPKSVFPQLAISPWNLVPICQLCNDQQHGKGDHPMLSEGIPNPTAEWLHPYFREAPRGRFLELTGPPQDVEIKLKCPTGAAQKALDNHVAAIKKISQRWKTEVGRYHTTLRIYARRKGCRNASQVKSLISQSRMDKVSVQGHDAYTLVHIAVCDAIINERPGYMDEMLNPNPLGLS